MTDAEFRLERESDDRWTGPRLVVLGAVTLGLALLVIYFMAASAAPY